MFYLENPITLQEFNELKNLMVTFKFYNNRGKLFEIITHHYFRSNDKYLVKIKNLSIMGDEEVYEINDTENMIKEINEWIKHSYYCNEKGSIIMYTLAEKENEL